MARGPWNLFMFDLLPLRDVIHTEQQSDTAFIFTSEPDNLCGTATQSGDS